MGMFDAENTEEVESSVENKEFQAEEAKAPRMQGKKKVIKLVKNPIRIGGVTYSDDTFEIDVTALKKESEKYSLQLKRMFELKMIKEA